MGAKTGLTRLGVLKKKRKKCNLIKNLPLNPSNIERYSRQLNLPNFNLEQQEKLAKAKVLIVGAGGLGSPLILYLAAAGIGNLGIIDFDKVEIHNLHRQILYSSQDVGKHKVEVALQKVKAINPDIQCQIYKERLSTENVGDIFKNYDIIADGTDNFPTRYLINDACVKFEKVNVFASVHRYEGQLAIFNMKNKDGSYSTNYRDLFPTPPLEDAVPNCAEAGVLGPVVGMIACMQAQEVIKIASGMPSRLVDRILNIDLADHQMLSVKLKQSDDHHYRNSSKDEIILEDYDDICKLKINATFELDSHQILNKLASESSVKVIDVREPNEYDTHNIGAENIPKESLKKKLDQLDNSKTYILHCQSGKRSRTLLTFIKEKAPTLSVFHLEGGLNQWINEQGKERKLPSLKQ